MQPGNVARIGFVLQEKAKGMPKGPIEAVIKLLSEELRDLIDGLPESLQESVPKQLKGNRLASERSTDPKSSTPPVTP